MVCEEIHGPSPTENHDAAHTCGKGYLGCVSPKHIVWKTKAENQADRLIHGTHNRGEKSGNSKLTEKQVEEIRSLEGSMSQAKIAEKFSISGCSVSKIINKKAWAWLS